MFTVFVVSASCLIHGENIQKQKVDDVYNVGQKFYHSFVFTP